MDHTVQYLDDEISYNYFDYTHQIHTRVNHDPDFEPYALPYSSKTRKKENQFLKSSPVYVLFRAALFRAFLYCSDKVEFQNECLHI